MILNCSEICEIHVYWETIHTFKLGIVEEQASGGGSSGV